MPSPEGFGARAVRARLRKLGRGPTLLELAVVKVGVVRGGEALWNLVVWTMCRRKFGEEPGWVEFAEVGLVSRPGAYRALATLREVFGEDVAQAADVLDEKCGDQLDQLLAIEGGKNPTAATLVVGTLPAPVGLW